MECMFIMNRMGSPGSSVAAQRRRMALGVVILLLVDVIWVASSELTSYIFRRQEYNKPFFSTFTKTSMFVLYLLGFLLWRPWRQQCSGSLKRRHASLVHLNGICPQFADAEAYFAPCTNDSTVNNCLSEPLYVPVKFQEVPTDLSNCLIDTDCHSSASKKQRVRFSNIMEVRQLPSTQALEAKLSRMSYPAAKDHEAMLRTVGKLTITDVAKISFFFCFVWFLANLSYQEALSDTQVAIVNILSSTSGLFTLILAGIFPSNSSDRFTLSKLLAVALSMGGVVLVSLSAMDRPDEKATIGSLWALAGAFLYAIYIVMIKRRVDREDKLDIPMFFGFVGLFNLLLLWPGFLLLHYTGFEAFELPTQLVWSYIFINGLIGTVLSEFLWLWGCFLTSSLIGTLALSLTIPLSILADIFLQKVRFSWLFFAGAVPVFLSFFIATLLCHYNNWDPVMVGLRRLYAFVFRRHRIHRLPEDNELCESLIPLHTVSLNQGSLCS
ncbi:solute carrier family 35 member F5-like isoform X1 [Corythoichthys intestinalis]|uniref:solute carrier family 35 member F5-like isoform X1 n=1 Tax=Corythoichthys intestinalis TaxID=161448 RepID=UPI0025A68466|nr:solute carrier family 35 member F5-like isoform X1 [Corythoichthys intestinalis]